MTFQDIFKSSFLENTTSVGIFDMGLPLSWPSALACLYFWFTKRRTRV